MEERTALYGTQSIVDEIRRVREGIFRPNALMPYQKTYFVNYLYPLEGAVIFPYCLCAGMNVKSGAFGDPSDTYFEREGNALSDLLSKSGTLDNPLPVPPSSCYEALFASSSSR
jgi:hypothetical protein